MPLGLCHPCQLWWRGLDKKDRAGQGDKDPDCKDPEAYKSCWQVHSRWVILPLPSPGLGPSALQWSFSEKPPTSGKLRQVKGSSLLASPVADH